MSVRKMQILINFIKGDKNGKTQMTETHGSGGIHYNKIYKKQLL
jgi:hypothetical protein